MPDAATGWGYFVFGLQLPLEYGFLPGVGS